MVFLSDKDYMRMALNLAKRGLGRTWPNPSVGCLIVKDGVVIGCGRTEDGGRPHAEIVALGNVGGSAKGAIVYVTLEPCSHYGKTPPCAMALIKAGVKRVVIACGDPDKRVLGRGVAMLKDAGIDVEFGILEKEAMSLIAGFIFRVTQNRPFVTLKSATSSDNKIASKRGLKTKITGALAQQYAHLMRSEHDAILVGVGTVLADNPLLTTRVLGLEHNSLRIVLDSRGRVSKEYHLGVGGDDVLILTNSDVDTYNISVVLEFLAERGITRLLVEGGAQVNSSFLEAGFCDQFLWFKSSHEIGIGGLDALHGSDIANIETDFELEKQKTVFLGEDLLEIYKSKA